MNNLTALQQAMRITQRYANSLFDEHTARGRQFMQEMSECLELEREQIIDAHGLKYYDLKEEIISGEQYYNTTYKGGEQ